MYVMGIDGCRTGWVAFGVELPSHKTLVKLIDIPVLLRNRPTDLELATIDIPIGLLDGPRACDRAARQRLGWPRRNSVFSPPCRAALSARDHADACRINRKITASGLSRQAWGIAPKIKQVDDVIASDCPKWVYEVHPEVCFWALARQPMKHSKKTEDGATERVAVLRPVFPSIDDDLRKRPSGVATDDLLDAAVAAWTAIRLHERKAQRVCAPEQDQNGLEVAIWY